MPICATTEHKDHQKMEEMKNGIGWNRTSDTAGMNRVL
jgi:hypothetical protein